MNILFITPSFYPHIGGVEKHIEKIGEILQKQHTLTVLTEAAEEDLPADEVWKGIQVKRIPLGNITESQKKWKLWNWILHNRQWLSQFDLIHIHDVFFWVIPLLFFRHPRLYMTFHGYEGSEAPTLKQKMWHQLAAKVCRANICIGGFHEKWYGIHPTMTSFGAVEASKLKTIKTDRIVYVGRLHEDTGILTCIKALVGTGYQLDVYGDGPQRQMAEDLARQLGVEAVFHGFDSNISQRLSTYKVVFISRYLGILEAFSQQVPIIASYNNEIKFDYLTLTPFHQWISILSSSDDVRRRLLDILDGKRKTDSAVKSGYAWAMKQTWGKLAQQYEKLWSEY